MDYHDIASRFNDSEMITDNALVLFDGPLSSMLHLLILAKLEMDNNEWKHKINEILNAFSDKSSEYQQLVKIVTNEIKLWRKKMNAKNESLLSNNHLSPNTLANINNNGGSGSGSGNGNGNGGNYNANDNGNNNDNNAHGLNLQNMDSIKDAKLQAKKAKKLAKAKKKQKLLLKKFKAKQKKWEETKINEQQLQQQQQQNDGIISNNNSGGGGGGGGLMSYGSDDKTCDDEVCVICYQSATKQQPLGKIVFMQYSLFNKFSKMPGKNNKIQIQKQNKKKEITCVLWCV